MFAGVWITLMLVAGEATMSTAVQAALGAAAATVLARGGGAQGGAFSKLFPGIATLLARLAEIVRGAVSTIRAALAADVELTPGLIRQRTEALRGGDGVDAVTAIGAAPGAAVIALDGENALIHALDEGAVNPSSFQAPGGKRRAQ
jgi:multisubunit Na+/H+ antiporter MnhE subunit